MTLENYQLVERTKALYGHMFTLLVGTSAVAVVTVMVLWPVANQAWLSIWFAVMAILMLLRTMSVLRYKRVIITESNAKTWIGKVKLWSCLSGICWGLVLVLFSTPDQIFYFVFIVGVYCGFLSSSVSSMAIYFPAFLAFAVPASVLFIAKCIVYGASGYGIIFYLTAVVIVIFFAVMTSFAKNTQDAFNKTTQLTFENNALMAEVVEQKETAENAVLAKNQFLAAASHDLRQPLHALGLFVSALNEFDLEDEAREVTGKIEQSTYALNGLLNGLLDISRLDASAVECRPRHVFLQLLLKNIVAEYVSIAEDNGTVIEFEIDSDIAVEVDELLLQRVVRNLIDNAVKFTSDGVVGLRVAKALDDSSQYVELIVEDTGLGIPDDQQKNIFFEFTQLHNPERDRQKGLGLGLAIVNRLCKLMNLRMNMRSVLNEGTRFHIFLPVGDSQLAMNITQQSLDAEMSEMTIDSDLISFQGKVILVIDDEVDILQGMERLLRKWGARVIVAGDASGAIDKLNQLDIVPDLLIVDFRLRENVSGIDAIAMVREEYNIDIQAILITGDTSPDRLRLAQSAELAMLHKPVQPKVLNEAILQLLSASS
ncbi:MAG: ATP-binding response regulator [Arenicella sp.]